MDTTTLDRLLLAWPGTRAEAKWGNDWTYVVGERMFAVLGLGDANGFSLAFKAGPERFLELTDRPGVIPAPYLARAHWVQLTSARALSAAELRTLLRASYELVAAKLPRRTRLALGIES
jgi:predicted DNA-binding protein (MmcQ/YjbR family)